MECTRKNGAKVIVDGDKVQSGNGTLRKCIIGANFTNGAIHGGYLSSFNGCFSDELIGIQLGFGDIVNARIGNIKDAYELLKSRIKDIDSTNVYEVAYLILEVVDIFYGGFANIDTRMDYYYPSDFVESKDNKMSNLKGEGAAMCVERAALAQNLLQSLDINSFYKISGILRNGSKEVHSYNLVEFDDKYYIFDPTMPNFINTQANPLIAEIDRETFTLLSYPLSDRGISVTVSHYNPYRGTDVTVTYDSGREKSIEVSSLGENGPKHL